MAKAGFYTFENWLGGISEEGARYQAYVIDSVSAEMLEAHLFESYAEATDFFTNSQTPWKWESVSSCGEGSCGLNACGTEGCPQTCAAHDQ